MYLIVLVSSQRATHDNYVIKHMTRKQSVDHRTSRFCRFINTGGRGTYLTPVSYEGRGSLHFGLQCQSWSMSYPPQNSASSWTGFDLSHWVPTRLKMTHTACHFRMQAYLSSQWFWPFVPNKQLNMMFLNANVLKNKCIKLNSTATSIQGVV